MTLRDCKATELRGNVKAMSLFYTFVFFLPSMHSHSNFLHLFWFVWWGFFWLVGWVFSIRKHFDSLWVFNIFLFSQTYVKLNRCIKVNTFISRISILLLYTFPLFVVSNPVVLIVFLSIFCHLTFVFILCFLSFLIYLHLFPY